METETINQTEAGISPAQLTLKRKWTDTLRVTLRAVVKVKGGLWGGIFISIMLLCAIGAQWISPYDPNAQDIMHRFAGPSLDHFLAPTTWDAISSPVSSTAAVSP